LDCVGHQDLYCGSPAYLKEQGEVINVGAMADGMWRTVWNWFQNTWRPVWLGGTPRRYIMFSTVSTRDDGIYLLRMVEEGKLKVHIDSVWDMKDAIGAYERAASKRARGKVVIKVKED
jgi:D-arabinose 1-dehydrogenase-like Zn-dependent alcohol dehydrogenase